MPQHLISVDEAVAMLETIGAAKETVRTFRSQADHVLAKRQALGTEHDDDERDSGPFCRHWSDPLDCEEVCAACGHLCSDHIGGDCDLCACEDWAETE